MNKKDQICEYYYNLPKPVTFSKIYNYFFDKNFDKQKIHDKHTSLSQVSLQQCLDILDEYDININPEQKLIHTISHYIIIKDTNQKGVTKIKRSFRNVKNISVVKIFKNIEESKTFLRECRRNNIQHVGVIHDTNVIINDNFNQIPQYNINSPILYLEAQISEYTNNNNQSWSRCKIKSSNHYVLNLQDPSFDYTVDFNKEATVINTQYSYNTNDFPKNTSFEVIFSDMNLLSKTSYSKEIVEDLPKVSLICPFTDFGYFHNALISFLKIDYPKHLIELIVVLNKSTKHKMLCLPNDSRIKIVQLSQDSYPTSFALNCGIKQVANENLIVHWLDTSVYKVSLFKNLISNFVLSKKNCLLASSSGGVYNNESFESPIPSLGNMVYTKSYWNNNQFTISDSNSVVLYNFIYYRQDTVEYLPYETLGFDLKQISENKIAFDIKYLMDDFLKESFDLIKKMNSITS